MGMAAFNLILHESMQKYLGSFYSKAYLERLLASVATPASRYFLRVNTLKVSREELISRLRGEGLAVFAHPEVPEAIYLKVRGPNVVRVHRGKVFVDYPTAESAYVGANVYAPGVLKVENALPGDQVTILTPDNRPVAEGVLVMEPAEIFSKRKGKAVEVTQSFFKVESLRDHPVYIEGLIYHQSLPSMVAVRVLGPKPGWTVLDMCASPGGKATHAAQMMGDEGEVLAVDRSREKVNVIQENANRLGLRSLKTLVYDSRYISEVEGTNSFDAVILDPPCSALGVRPKLRYSRTYSDVCRLATYQRQFLSEAYKVLRREGLLLYSTCTISPLENELNVLYAAKELGFRLEPASYPNVKRPLLGIPGLLFDPVVNDTPGFFISILRKPR